MTLYSKIAFSRFCKTGLMVLAGFMFTQDVQAQQSAPASPQAIQQSTPNRAQRKPFKLTPIPPASFKQQVQGAPMQTQDAFANEGFCERHGEMGGAPILLAPMGKTLTPEQVHGELKLQAPGPKDEYLIDGSDRNFRAYVDDNWNVHGLDTEDTIGHFDTLDGRRIATPSNRVAIYAPRFATVRRVSDVSGGSITSRLASANDQTRTVTNRFQDMTSSTLQNLQPQRHKMAQRPLAFLDRTRGVTSDSVMHMAELSKGFQAYENLQLIKFWPIGVIRGDSTKPGHHVRKCLDRQVESFG